jgi:hypothetical protein
VKWFRLKVRKNEGSQEGYLFVRNSMIMALDRLQVCNIVAEPHNRA